MLSLMRGFIAISPFMLLMALMLSAAIYYGGILWLLFGSAALIMGLIGAICFNYAQFKADLAKERSERCDLRA